MKTLSKIALFLATLLAATTNCFGLTYNLPAKGDDIVGQVQTVSMHSGQNFYQLARQYDVGYQALVDANPGINPMECKKDTQLVLPTIHILPPGDRQGIIINVAEMHLYYFPPGQNTVMVFPVGVGKQGWATPTGTAVVMEKIKNPVWTVPDSITQYLAQQGMYTPEKVQPGPEDPLGYFALRLTIPGYLIHGTNMPDSIGVRSSSGCIRMYPEDIETLFNAVTVNTPVRIMDDPFKIGMSIYFYPMIKTF